LAQLHSPLAKISIQFISDPNVCIAIKIIGFVMPVRESCNYEENSHVESFRNLDKNVKKDHFHARLIFIVLISDGVLNQ